MNFINYLPKSSLKRNMLTSFARAHCCNWDDNEGCCQTVGPCRLQRQKPCNWFRTAILPICDPNYPFASPAEVKNYKRIYENYLKIDKSLSTVPISNRKCQCGAPLLPRKKLCLGCRGKNRRLTKKIYQRKYRHSM